MGTIVKRNTFEVFRPIKCRGHFVFIKSIEILSKRLLTKELLIKVSMRPFHDDLCVHYKHLSKCVKNFLCEEKLCNIKFIRKSYVVKKESCNIMYLLCN